MTSVRARTRFGVTGNVQAATRPVEPGRGLGSRGTPQEIFVPFHLLRRAVREEKLSEHSAKGRIRQLPAGADRTDDGVFFLVLAAEPSSSRIPAVEDEVRDALRVPSRVRHRDRRSLGHA